MTIRRQIPLAAVLATAAAALGAAGCGSGSDQPSAADTRAAYQSIRAQIVGLGGSIGQEITDASRETDAQLSIAFEQLHARGEAVIAKLRGLEVPSDLQDKRDALRDALDRGTADLADVADAVRAHDAAAARSAAEQLVRDSQTIRDTRDSFERALADATQ
jgi:hypothetical protein